jgi:hypothetical protein
VRVNRAPGLLLESFLSSTQSPHPRVKIINMEFI